MKIIWWINATQGKYEIISFVYPFLLYFSEKEILLIYWFTVIGISKNSFLSLRS